MREIVFAEHRSAVGPGFKPQTAEVARFKEDNGTAPRVVAASQTFIVYSLKARSSLRVLPRAPGKQTQLSYKKHTDDVTAASFVNMRSNIVASASKNELLVWCIDDDNQIHTYFSCNERVVSFSWVPVSNQPPDLLIMIDRGATKEASLLKASSLIVESTTIVGGAVGKPDGNMVAQSTHFVTLRKDIAAEAALTGAASPIIAYSVSNDSVVTASLGNLDTPAWKACEGDKLTSLAVMPNEILIAAGHQGTVHVWSVAGEPQALQRIVFGPRRCTAVHCTSASATLFLTTGNPNLSEAVVLMMQPKVGAVATAIYDVESSVSAMNSCVVAGNNDEPRLHVDSGALLFLCLLQGAAWNPFDGAAAVPPAAISSPKSNKTSKQNSTAYPTSPAIAAPTTAARPAANGTVAPFFATPSNEVDALKEHIEKALANTASMISVSKNVVTKDHNMLIQEALRAQAKVLASLAASNSRGGAVAPAGGSSAFDAVIEGITEPVATALVEGISAAIEEQLRTQLESALRNVLTRQEKKKQRDQMAEVRAALDTIVADVMVAVQQTVQQKQTAYASRLIHYVSDVASEGASAVAQLQQTVTQQQQQLAALTQSGLLEEVRRLRAEVAELKAARFVGANAPAAAAEIPKETVLANAQSHIEGGDHITGLNWVIQYDDAAMLVQLLSSCSAVTIRNAMLEDAAVPIAIWSKIAGALASTPKQETLEPTLEWLCDILAEKPPLLQNDQLIVAISNFINAWKSSNSLTSNAKNKLRQIVMLVRR